VDNTTEGWEEERKGASNEGRKEGRGKKGYTGRKGGKKRKKWKKGGRV
jgi:hypothetical protein